MMDCYWNAAIEEQACAVVLTVLRLRLNARRFDRVHRFGQERDVHIVRFLIKQSVECVARELAQPI
jgi:hypothetical protein